MPSPSSSRSTRKTQTSQRKTRPAPEASEKLCGRLPRAGETASIARLLKRVVTLFRDALEETLRPYGVTAAQLRVLAKLDQEQGLSGAKLARLCAVTPQTMQALIAAIEGNGWIRRKHHPENERILLARLTPAGERILSQCHNAVEAIEKRMLRDFLSVDTASLGSLLDRCANNLQTNQARGELTRFIAKRDLPD